MTGSNIYSDFSQEIIWLKNRIIADLDELPENLITIAEAYTKKRLQILSENIGDYLIDPEIGRPVPYAVFWLADALKPIEIDKVRKLALTMTYSSIVTTLRDDIIDNESSMTQLYNLSNIYEYKYLKILDELFDRNSPFWHIFSKCNYEVALYENWLITTVNHKVENPLSDDYLIQSSRYFKAVVLPSLAGLAHLTGNEEKISVIDNFLYHFSMGWRIYDDIKDWKNDLQVQGFNHSTVLLYVVKNSGNKNLTESSVQSMLLSEKYVDEIYDTIIYHFNAAKNCISVLPTNYFAKFMDEQISYQNRQRQYFKQIRLDFYKKLNNILEKNAI
jgi:hypothetical protein